MLEFANQMARTHGRPPSHPEWNFAEAMQWQLERWTELTCAQHPPVPSSWKGFPHEQLFSGTPELMEKLDTLWAAESAYIAHDVVIRLAQDFAEYWDEESILCKNYEWLIKHRNDFMDLPSDGKRL